MLWLNKRTNSYFTSKYLVNIGINEDRACEIIEGLLKYGFLTHDTVQIDDQDYDIYVYRNTPALIILFTTLDLIVKRQNHWCYCLDKKI